MRTRVASKLLQGFGSHWLKGLDGEEKGEHLERILNPKPNIRSMLGEMWAFWLGQCACGEVASHEVGNKVKPIIKSFAKHVTFLPNPESQGKPMETFKHCNDRLIFVF